MSGVLVICRVQGLSNRNFIQSVNAIFVPFRLTLDFLNTELSTTGSPCRGRIQHPYTQVTDRLISCTFPAHGAALDNPIPVGFIIIDTHHLIADSIEKLPSVLTTMIITGRYDLFAVVLVPSHKTLVEFVTDQLSKVPGVRDSETYVVLRHYNQWIPADKLSSMAKFMNADIRIEESTHQEGK